MKVLILHITWAYARFIRLYRKYLRDEFGQERKHLDRSGLIWYNPFQLVILHK